MLNSILKLGIKEYLDELNNTPANEVDNKINYFYDTLSNINFYILITEYYQNSSDYVQKLVQIYKKNSLLSFNKTINETLSSLHNVVNLGSKKYNLNNLVSDIRDVKKFSNLALKSQMPTSIDLRNDLLGIRDQKPTECSVGISVATMIEFLKIKKNLYSKYIDPFCSTNPVSPKDTLELLKPKYINDYAYVNSINDLKLALNQNGPCIIEFPCFNSGRFFWKKSSDLDTLLGAHCAVVVGYDATRGFLIRNSWGENWGEFGYTWFPYEDWGHQMEVWTSINTLQINNVENAPIISITPFQINISESFQNINFSDTTNIIFVIIVILLIVMIITKNA